ncbi:MAG TPA: hypothetical protein VGL98_04680 [Gammaproteobacteria bacterium]
MSSKYPWAVFVAAGACATAGIAQPPTPPETPDKLFFVENLPPLMTTGARVDFIRSEGGVPGPVVKGKPYSARSITESTQTLADGNRITERNEAVIYRDSEGRTRREQTLSGIGPFQPGEPVTMINIHDPVAGKGYTLHPDERIAREMPQFQMAIAHDRMELAKAAGEARVFEGRSTFNVAVPPPVPGTPIPEPAPVPAPFGAGTASVTVIQRTEGDQNVRVYTRAERGVVLSPFPEGTTGAYEPAEDLGEQVLEGLLVKGTRMTDTIPAGTIGNDRQIDIVTERWYSEDINAMVLERYSDPRFGETTYRLVNVVRGEPSPDLFQVPQGYEIKAPEMATGGIRIGGPGAPGAGGVVHFELQPEPAPAR